MTQFGEIENGKTLTFGELFLLMERMMEKNPKLVDFPVVIVENIMQKGMLIPSIRHFEENDITIENNLQLATNNIISVFEKAIIFGYVPITDETF